MSAAPVAPSAGPLGAPVGDAYGTYTPAPARPRLDAIDLLRGVVMVIMLLDHTRDFTHASGTLFDPTDLSRTNPALFFTRWITHFCAPIFVFLAGTGAYLMRARGKTPGELSRFLVSRGLWLIVLELTAVRLLAFFDANYHYFGFLQVIWVIGWSMILLAALLHLPLRAVGAFGVGMIVLHNLLDDRRVPFWFPGPNAESVPSWGARVWMLLHQGGFFPLGGFPTRSNPTAAASPIIMVLYPLIPWLGVVAAGYAFGAVYQWDAARRQRFLLRLGLGLTSAFFLLRAANYVGVPGGLGDEHGYGDPRPWTTTIQVPVVPQPPGPPARNAPPPAMKTVHLSPAFVALSFFNVTKYPPSLLFLLMTLGPAMLALRAFERMPGRGRLRGALVTFGRVPMFYYLLQWPTAHLAGLLLSLAAGKSTALYFQTPLEWVPPANYGFPLWVSYLAWITGVLLLYPLCRWWAGLKARRRDWWLSYL